MPLMIHERNKTVIYERFLIGFNRRKNRIKKPHVTEKTVLRIQDSRR